MSEEDLVTAYKRMSGADFENVYEVAFDLGLVAVLPGESTPHQLERISTAMRRKFF